MPKLKEEVVRFFRNQGFVIVATIRKDGSLHNSCKGILNIVKSGKVYLLDLYRGLTFKNITNNPTVSLTAVDEHKFIGYSLNGKAEIVPEGKLKERIINAWEKRITSRITRRMIRNIHGEKGRIRHPEALLPKPEYLMVVKVDEVIDLTPRHLK